jgi:hypothetical protein
MTMIEELETGEYDVTEPEREAYLAQLRGLVEAGGLPYIRITFDADNQAHIDALGIDGGVIPAVLREIADLVEEQAA